MPWRATHAFAIAVSLSKRDSCANSLLSAQPKREETRRHPAVFTSDQTHVCAPGCGIDRDRNYGNHSNGTTGRETVLAPLFKSRANPLVSARPPCVYPTLATVGSRVARSRASTSARLGALQSMTAA